MPLESCMLVLDNSEYMRNGDYTPTRFQAQAQAVSAVFSAKTDANPESAVGLMTMAGKSSVKMKAASLDLLVPTAYMQPSLLVTPTNDIGKLLSALNKASIGGVSDLITSIQIAQLALKHRENKNQRQRVVVFVGSPLDDTQEELVKLGKKLRKNNVLIDLVTFGEEGMANDEKLNALIEAAGGGESHLVSVPPGPHLLSDVIQQSPILYDADRAGAGDSGGGGGGMDDFDPNTDPELAMALRMSLQEEQERQARERGAAGPSTDAPKAPVPAGDGATSRNTAVEEAQVPKDVHGAPNPEQGHTAGFSSGITGGLTNALDPSATAPGDDEEMEDDDDEDEEAMLARAMALSRGEDPDVDMDDGEEDEEAAIARAIAMSLEDQGGDKDKKP